jgi:hypothetical protein
VVRQVRDRLVVEIDDVAEIDGRPRNRLVLAELPVGRLRSAMSMPRNALLAPIACGSSMAVAIRSSILISSISNALTMWMQPACRSCATCGRSRSRSNCVFTASGVVITWLSASAVANILMRSVSIAPCGRSEAKPGLFQNALLVNSPQMTMR